MNRVRSLIGHVTSSVHGAHATMRRNRALRVLLCVALQLRGAHGASDSSQYDGFDGFVASVFLVGGAVLLFVIALILLLALYICGRRTQSAALVMLDAVERRVERKNEALQAEHALAIEEMLAMQTGLLAQMEEMQSRLDAVESGGPGSAASAARSSDDTGVEASASRRASGDSQPSELIQRAQSSAAQPAAQPAAAVAASADAAQAERRAASGAATPERAAAPPAARAE